MNKSSSTTKQAGRTFAAAPGDAEVIATSERLLRGRLRRVLPISIAVVMSIVTYACASSHVMIGEARPAISPNDVQVYSHPPNVPYEEIARLDTSSQGSFSFTAQRKSDAVINRLKAEAAKLGANGVVLEGMTDETSGSIGTGGSGGTYSGGGSFGGGIGLNAGLSRKAGAGVAIFVPQ